MSGPLAFFSAKNSAFLGLGVGIVLGFFTSNLPSAQAQPYPALRVCDIGYYETLKEKGWMEAMREVQVNNTVITQPASVLALSCFDGHAGQVSSGGSIFTNTGSSPSNVANAISTTMGGSLTNFVGNNFSGSSAVAGFSAPAGGYNNCKRLSDMWKEVKCATVDDKNGMNGFLLSELDQFRANAAAGTDVRGSTGTPTCTNSLATLDTRYTDGMISSTDLAATTTARGANYFSAARPNFCAYDPKEGAALSDGQICSTSAATPKKCEDMPAIPTGLAVTYTGGSGGNDPWGEPVGTAYWSYRCLNPGCYFDVKTNASSIKFTAGGTPPAMKCTYKPY